MSILRYTLESTTKNRKVCEIKKYQIFFSKILSKHLQFQQV